jgi:hypothetical protein
MKGVMEREANSLKVVMTHPAVEDFISLSGTSHPIKTAQKYPIRGR